MSNLIKLAALTKNTPQESITLSNGGKEAAAGSDPDSFSQDHNVAVAIESAQHSINSESLIRSAEKLITIQEEMTEMSPAYMVSPRSCEISLLTKMITDCFENVQAKTGS